MATDPEKPKKPKPDLTGYVLPEQLALMTSANDNRGLGIRSFTKSVSPHDPNVLKVLEINPDAAIANQNNPHVGKYLNNIFKK